MGKQFGIFEEDGYVEMIDDLFRGNNTEEGRVYKVLRIYDDTGDSSTRISLIKVSKNDGTPLSYKRRNLVTISVDIDKFDSDGYYKDRKVFKKISEDEKVKGQKSPDSSSQYGDAREAGLQVGDFLYTSWGYNQTNVDFAIVTEISDTGKTIKAQRVGAEVVDQMSGTFGSHKVVPKGEGSGEEFRLHVRKYDSDNYSFNGKYPLSENNTTKGHFSMWNGKPVRETPTGQGH